MDFLSTQGNRGQESGGTDGLHPPSEGRKGNLWTWQWGLQVSQPSLPSAELTQGLSHPLLTNHALSHEEGRMCSGHRGL